MDTKAELLQSLILTLENMLDDSRGEWLIYNEEKDEDMQVYLEEGGVLCVDDCENEPQRFRIVLEKIVKEEES